MRKEASLSIVEDVKNKKFLMNCLTMFVFYGKISM